MMTHHNTGVVSKNNVSKYDFSNNINCSIFHQNFRVTGPLLTHSFYGSCYIIRKYKTPRRIAHIPYLNDYFVKIHKIVDVN